MIYTDGQYTLSVNRTAAGTDLTLLTPLNSRAKILIASEPRDWVKKCFLSTETSRVVVWLNSIFVKSPSRNWVSSHDPRLWTGWQKPVSCNDWREVKYKRDPWRFVQVVGFLEGNRWRCRFFTTFNTSFHSVSISKLQFGVSVFRGKLSFSKMLT